MAPLGGHHGHHFSQIFLTQRGKTTLLREICIVLDETWSAYRDSPLVFLRVRQMLCNGVYCTQMAPPSDQRGIILRKMCFAKAVKPHCCANYIPFLVKLGQSLDSHPCITRSGFNLMLRGLLHPKRHPKCPPGASF